MKKTTKDLIFKIAMLIAICFLGYLALSKNIKDINIKFNESGFEFQSSFYGNDQEE